jgi:hypothetical protein
MEILRKIRKEYRKTNELGFQDWLSSSHLLRYMEATESLKYPSLTTRDTSPSRAVLEDLKLSPSDGCPRDRNLLSLDACPPLRRFWTASSRTGQTGAPHRSDRSPPVRPVWRCCSSVFGSSVLALWINQGTQWFSGEPPETPRTRCSLRQSPLMTRLPRSPGSTLVLRLNQETVHDFILLFMPPCDPHLTPLAIGSLGQSLLVFSTPGGLTGDDLSRLFFTCTNNSQAATCTCNT